jgi:predicted nucleic acid-binding protein
VTERGRGVVIDASAVVALLSDHDDAGPWVAASIEGQPLMAPHLMPYEAANILRRLALSGILDGTTVSLAHGDLVELTVDLVPYQLLAARSWALRDKLTAYDASYVALAEALEVPLVTLDQRIAGAPGIRCEVRTPSGG